MTTMRIQVSRLRCHADNPVGRRTDIAELAASIRAVGILQPLIVEPHGTGYVVLAGNRRLAAARLLGHTDIECIVRPGPDPRSHAVIRVVENGHRRNLSPIEQARGFGELRADGLTQPEIAKRTGFSISHVSARLALLDLDSATQDRVDRGALSPADALTAVRTAREVRKRVTHRPSRPAATSRERRRNGEAPGRTFEAAALTLEHFGRGHRLAARAGAVCRRTHGELLAMAGLGGVACGRCWESAIRADERTRAAQTTAAPTPQEAV